MTIAKKLQLFSGQTPPRSTSVEGKARPAPLQKFGSRQTRKDISARPCNETANYGTKT